MSYFVCLASESPCQPANQVAVTDITVQDLAALGITPQSLSASVGIGFALVFSLAMLGYGLGVALRVIQKL